jgi:AsmA protein
MSKVIKIVLFSTLAVAGALFAGVLYIVATFDPNDYKEKIIQVVHDKTQRTLRLDGDLKLSFYPDLGVTLNQVSLSEFKQEQKFVSIDLARVSLALIPLLNKKMQVKQITLNGVQGTLVKHRDGTSNLDDFFVPQTELAPATPGAPVQFDVAKVEIAKTNLAYVDELSGARYALKNLHLTTSRIALGVPVKLALSFALEANQPNIALQTDIKTLLNFDVLKQRYELSGLQLSVAGKALDITNIEAQATGDLTINSLEQSMSAHQFSLKVNGIKAQSPFSAQLSAPKLNLTKNNYSGADLTLNTTLAGAFGQLTAALVMPNVTGNVRDFKVDNLSLDAQLLQSQQTLKVKMHSLLLGNMTTQKFELNNLAVELSALGDALPNKAVRTSLKGNVQLNLPQQSVKADLAGGVFKSQIRAKIELEKFANPAVKFDVNVDQFDADLYLPSGSPETTKSAGEPEQKLDLSALRGLNLQGLLRIGELKIANLKLQQLQLDAAAHEGLINIKSISANLYQGNTSGSAQLDARTTPSLVLKQNLQGIDVAALSKDALNFDTLEGQGNVILNLASKGNKVSELKRALNGFASLNLSDGAIKGINLAKKMRDTKAMLTAQAQTEAANKAEKTDFSELKASFVIANGIAHNEDLSMKSPLLRLSGLGDINLGEDSINYLAKVTLAKTLEGQGGVDTVTGLMLPVRVSGPFTNLKYGLEFSAMVSDGMKQKLADAKRVAQQKIEDAKLAGQQKIDQAKLQAQQKITDTKAQLIQKVDDQKQAVQQQIELKKDEVKMQAQEQLKEGLKGLFK